MPPLSVFIITKNEARNLPRCLKALGGLADDIVVLDSGSTDGTQDIARRHGARVEERAFDGFGQQKHAAERLCRHDWVLNLDADEFLTPALRSEIAAFLAGDGPERYDGVRIKLMNVYPHASRPRPFADYHDYIRLYDKRALSFPQHPTQDAVVARDESRIARFEHGALHYSFASLDALETKLRARTHFYFEQEPRGRLAKNLLRLATEYPFSLFKACFLRRHVTGGIYGLKISHIYAKYRFIRILQRVRGRPLV